MVAIYEELEKTATPMTASWQRNKAENGKNKFRS